VRLAVYLDGAHVQGVDLPRAEVDPGARATLCCTFRAPIAPGRHELQVRLTTRGGATLEDQGAVPLCVPFETVPQPPALSTQLMDQAQATNHWHFRPSSGVFRSAEGPPYPLFARSAKGCRITDLEGREYIDYIMGFSCALLGYANERVQRAVRDALDSAGVISLPHTLEMDVTRMLCDMIPCAEMVIFGKNGSDVCTAAARLARAATGRSKILVCGYHGWQDWYIETRGFSATGVPDRSEPLVLPFPFNDLNGFLKVLRAHAGEVAAVMLEPSGPVEDDGLNGPLQDVDADFLAAVAAATRRAGALLIFDEIITGFRYPGGSVQKATGVIPDLACFGKALSAGMPLSALVGRRQIMDTFMHRVYYGPTFQSEVYSLAAAREALAIYREVDVPGHIWDYGNRLKAGINRLCHDLGVRAEVIGPPFRMVLAFREPDAHHVTLMRTLVQQELLKRGVLTYMGFMLPSYAHDDRVLDETLDAFAHALGLLAQAERKGSFASYLEVPPIGW
jgi:glutamate-1-semialdehyde 2,1-aminomutase